MKLTGKHTSCWLVCALIGISTMRFSLCVTAQNANITIPPKPVNISLNEVAEFNCTGVASNFVWKKNGAEVIHNGMEIVITQAVVNEMQSIRMSTMREMVSSLDSNGANITCTAVKLSPLSNDESQPALLLVQGLLESVSNLTVYSINSTTVLISWRPPFTLKGVPILGYNVTITYTLSGINETVSIERDSNMLHYNFIDPDPNTNYTITVVPINNVGVGNTSAATFFYKNMITTSFSSQTSNIEFTPVSTLETSMTQSLSPPLSSSLSPSLSPSGASLSAIIGGSMAVVILVGTLALIFLCISVLLLRRRRGHFYYVKDEEVEKNIVLQPCQQLRDSDESKPRNRIPWPTGEDVPDSRETSKAQKLAAGESLKAVLTKFESDNFLILHENFMLETKIGNGFFGEVFEAKVRNNRRKITAKTCKPTNSDAMKCQFLYEAEIMRHYTHSKIVQLIGVVFNELDPLSIVMEHVGFSFHFFLKAGNGQECSKNVLTAMCKQVCEGMEYLERNKCVHRGLSAKSCFVSEHDDFTVKISNFGVDLEKIHLDPSDPKLRPAPIKWTAPEALKHDQYTSASDVWSFGVLMWEAFSRGKVPYGKTHKDKVREKVIKGDIRMSPPKNCPPPVYKLMTECWKYNPNKRPTFVELLKELCKLIRPEETEEPEASDHE